ncbi:hypothetical protein KKE45_02890 [Patescibacteria group bacterium]|nr:hypothetical protein [Patescibacteria group bacterium]
MKVGGFVIGSGAEMEGTGRWQVPHVSVNCARLALPQRKVGLSPERGRIMPEITRARCLAKRPRGENPACDRCIGGYSHNKKYDRLTSPWLWVRRKAEREKKRLV